MVSIFHVLNYSHQLRLFIDLIMILMTIHQLFFLTTRSDLLWSNGLHISRVELPSSTETIHRLNNDTNDHSSTLLSHYQVRFIIIKFIIVIISSSEFV